jgi:pyruvate/2-oxoglutarate dehydrogenase complex dihydrolipoamide acyltransferase (E2) component
MASAEHHVKNQVNESLDYAERWLRDGFSVLRPAFFAVQISVDMSNAVQRLEALKRDGVQATRTHLVVHATARVLAAHPDLHLIVAGTRRHRPQRVDIGLSVAGEMFAAPVLILEGADQKSVPDLEAEIKRRVPEVRAADQKMLATLRRWGWLVPFGFMRRALLRVLFSSPGFRRKGVGSFQVSTVPAEWAVSGVFSTTGVLIAGEVSPKVVAVAGKPEVRPMMALTLSGDHGVWDGRTAIRFLNAVKAELERPALEPEVRHSADESARATISGTPAMTTHA